MLSSELVRVGSAAPGVGAGKTKCKSETHGCLGGEYSRQVQLQAW